MSDKYPSEQQKYPTDKELEAFSKGVEELRKSTLASDPVGACYVGAYGCYGSLTYKQCTALGKKFHIGVNWYNGERCKTRETE